jgi:hypothetical protein
LVLVLVVIFGNKHQPHVEVGPPAVSIAMPPMPVASGGIVPKTPTWNV